MAIVLFGAVSIVERVACPWLAPAGDDEASVGEHSTAESRTLLA